MDSRFPWMIPVDRASSDRLPRNGARVVREVCRRVPCNAAFNTRCNGVMFYLSEDMAVGVHQEPAHALRDGVQDRLVKKICSGRASRREKQRLADRAEADRKYAQQKEMESKSDIIRSEAESRLAYRDKKRDMGKHFKGSALVNETIGGGG